MRVATADNSHRLRKDENGGSTDLIVKRVNWLRARIGAQSARRRAQLFVI